MQVGEDDVLKGKGTGVGMCALVCKSLEQCVWA